jgi:hypothetical protein
MVEMCKIVETDAFCRDYPDERFLNLPPMSKERCERICSIINAAMTEHCDRYWKTVPKDYVLEPGFEP